LVFLCNVKVLTIIFESYLKHSFCNTHIITECILYLQLSYEGFIYLEFYIKSTK